MFLVQLNPFTEKNHLFSDGTMDERAMLVLLGAIVTALNAVADGESMTTPDIGIVLALF